MNTRRRIEHLELCKRRALDYLAEGNLVDAVTSMVSDLTKHPDTKAIGTNPYLIMIGMLHAQNYDAEGVHRWIEGFN